MKKQLTSIIFFFLFFVQAIAQQKVTFGFAARHNRESIVKQLRIQIDTVILLPLNELTYTKYEAAYWAMELMLYHPKGYEKIIPKHVLQLPSTDSGFQRAFLEMLYTLYSKQFISPVKSVLAKLANDKVKAIALEYSRETNICFLQAKAGGLLSCVQG